MDTWRYNLPPNTLQSLLLTHSRMPNSHKEKKPKKTTRINLQKMCPYLPSENENGCSLRNYPSFALSPQDHGLLETIFTLKKNL